jgi:hypothetical protein
MYLFLYVIGMLAAAIYCVQFIIIIFNLIDNEFKSKKEFLYCLIPFYFIFDAFFSLPFDEDKK